MIYDINGNQLNVCYDKNGNRLNIAYDKDGNVVYRAGDSTQLTVMSYNVGQWYCGTGSNVPTDYYQTFYELQRAIMAEHNPDVASFQEYYEPFSEGHTVDDVIGDYFTYHVNNSDGAYNSKAIYTNGYAIDNYLKVSFGDGSGRSYLRSTITVDGKQIWLLNAHLSTSSAESQKVAQASTLLNVVSSLPYFILMGDFNTVCKSVNDEEYTTIMKQFIDAGYHSANCSEQHGFIDTWTSGNNASGTWYPCDQIITSSNIDIVSVIADTTKLDMIAGRFTIDHIPIVADLIIN